MHAYTHIHAWHAYMHAHMHSHMHAYMHAGAEEEWLAGTWRPPTTGDKTTTAGAAVGIVLLGPVPTAAEPEEFQML